MPKTRSMASLPSSPNHTPSPHTIPLPISSDSSMEESSHSNPKKRPSLHRPECSKRPCPVSLSPDETSLFWGVDQKKKFQSLLSRTIVPGRIINLDQLKLLHCPVRKFFKTQDLTLLFQLVGVEFFEEPVRLFYANLRLSPDSGELETLVLGRRIVINDVLFSEVFCTMFNGVVPYMSGTWPDNFEVSLEGAKSFIAEEGTDISTFCLNSLSFENRVLAHIIATTLLPRKGSLSTLSNRDIFVLYCLLKKIRINWAMWFREYLWESFNDSSTSASLPYGLLISRILNDCVVDLRPHKPIAISATYDSRTFASMGYVLVDKHWVKKEDAKGKQPEVTKLTRVSADSATLLLKEAEDIKCRLEAMEKSMADMHISINKVLQLSKDSSSDLGKLRIGFNGLKKDGLSLVNKLFGKIEGMRKESETAQNDLAVAVQNAYESLCQGVERSYDTFGRNVHNTLRYFLHRHNS